MSYIILDADKVRDSSGVITINHATSVKYPSAKEAEAAGKLKAQNLKSDVYIIHIEKVISVNIKTETKNYE